MDADKVRELIADLERDIESKVRAIKALKSLLTVEPREESSNASATPHLFQAEQNASLASESYIDLAVRAVEQSPDEAVSMKDIVSFIRRIKGNPAIERRSVEATVARHMKAKGQMARLIKVGPGMYASRRYFRAEPAA